MNMNTIEITPVTNGFVVNERAPLSTNLFGTPKTWVFASTNELLMFITSQFDPVKGEEVK